jgi:DNA-binding transcriptional LysR family regulator
MSGPLDDMTIFAAVVRHGTLTGAARSLGVTKQSISQRIVRLEQRIGVELLLRSPRALRLTEAGARYHESCVSIISQVEEAELEAQQSQHSTSGTVRVTAPVGLSAGLIMPAVYAFQRSYPAIRVELLFEEKLVDLIRDGVDLAVRAGSVKSTPSFVARSLFDVANVIVASPDYLRLHGSPRDPGALRSMPCVTGRRAETWTVDRQNIVVGGSIVVNTFEAARDAATAGIGLACVPIPIVVDDLHSGRLEIVFVSSNRTTLTALWPVRRLPHRVRLLFDSLVRRGREFARLTESVVASSDRRVPERRPTKE